MMKKTHSRCNNTLTGACEENSSAMGERRLPARPAQNAVPLLVMPVVLVLCLAALCCKTGPEQSGPEFFATPDDAARSLYDAAQKGSEQALVAIFGPDAKEYLVSGDPVQDKNAFATFTTAFDAMHRWGKLDGDGLVLIIGVENYPFPFPLMKNANGQWYFDAASGRQEFLARRIGRNELTVIDVLTAMADAQDEYFSEPRDGSKVRQYARKFMSAEGKHDGLYWKAAENENESPLGPLAARAAAEGYTRSAETPAPFQGYYFRILTSQGPHANGGVFNYLVNGSMTKGFAFLAYPAEYRSTGVMTFLINQDGEIFEKDLGAQTPEVAKSIDSFDPDPTWSVVE